MTAIYLDMDGVLADFDAGLRILGIEPAADLNKSRAHMTPEEVAQKDEVYRAISAGPFFNRLPLMPGAGDLWDFCAPFEPVILTAAPSTEDGMAKATLEKREWIETMFGPIPDHRFICTKSSLKCHHVGHAAGEHQILVDDRLSNISQWEEAGGRGVLHSSAATSIAAIELSLKVPVLPDSTHWWRVVHGTRIEACNRCGIVRRRNHQNSPCRGKLNIGLREQAVAV